MPAYDRGVQLRVIVNGTTANQGIDNLNAAIPKMASPSAGDVGIMHNKFVIFDAYNSDQNVPLLWTR